MKKCTKCKKVKDLSNFNKDKAKRDGLRFECKACLKVYRQGRKDYQKQYQKIYKKTYSKENTRKASKKWYEKNKDRVKYMRSLWLLDNADYQKEYSKNNRPRFNQLSNKRRALKKNATPTWSETDKIKILYQKAKWLESLTGLKYHVDHIIPLNHPEVCGLHVWSNLQILESTLNLEKSNKLL